MHGVCGVKLSWLEFIRTNLARFFGVSERSGRVLTDVQSQDLHHAGLQFCTQYLALARLSIRLAHVNVCVAEAYCMGWCMCECV